jgi:Periplasmic lysozyme inhibitor of I-type lysozyme
MKIILLLIITIILSLGTLTLATEIRKELLPVTPGEHAETVKGRIRGHQIVDYQVRARAGQSIVAILTSSNLSAYFNVLPPGSETAIFIGSSSGERFEGEIPADGVYTIRVYLMRNAARRDETARYTLTVSSPAKTGSTASAAKSASPTERAFHRILELQGVRFSVSCANEGSINTLRIIPDGLKVSNEPIARVIDGTVTGAEIADLNADGSPEIYVYVTSAGSGSYGTVVGYSANRLKSLSEIYLPPLTDDPAASKGYMGHDEFAVLEGVLGRRFPLYRGNDTNNKPTGGMRQLHYKLTPGEAGWILKVDRIVEY